MGCFLFVFLLVGDELKYMKMLFIEELYSKVY